MTSRHGSSSSRRLMSSSSSTSSSSRKKRTNNQNNNENITQNLAADSNRKSLTNSRSSLAITGERTVRRLRLSRALTVPDTTTIYEACCRMASRRVDALLLTDSNALLSGILTDKDVATKVIPHEIDFMTTPVSKVMTKNPIYVLSDTLAVEALQKMVQGKFRHLPVVENGEVIALLDIAKCLYDAIARMERAAEKGKAIAAAVEGPNTFIETLRDKMFKPTLSTIISENSKIVTVSPFDTVVMATKKMLEFRSSSAIVTVDNKPRGILTSKDILTRVIAQDIPAESTLVEKVMTPNPECVTIDTPIVDALHTMHDGKFLHLPVVDRDGFIVSIVDVLHITHAAIATVGNATGTNNEVGSSMMQKFWDSAMALSPIDDEDDTRSESSVKLPSENGDTGKSPAYPSSSHPNTFAFKIQDKMGRMHRFICDSRSLTDLITAIIQRLGGEIDRNNLPQILYEDEDQDKVVISSDYDLSVAVEHAHLAGWKGLKLHLDYYGTSNRQIGSKPSSVGMEVAQADAWASAYSAAAAGAALVAGLGMLAILRRSSN
uniref:CBS domain-containing protein CBSCBSPB1-like isoform X2 n=1 Tax=Erigeron canadensis TaxID=72917 RepID=UPI001CB91234|nr:CBS domain-containing protein CBSCBSPB1-like isoform X2 [Erigeron canadensis]